MREDIRLTPWLHPGVVRMESSEAVSRAYRSNKLLKQFFQRCHRAEAAVLIELANAAAHRITNGAVSSGPIECPEAIPGTALTRGVSTIVTAAPTPTMLYNWTTSTERIRIHP